MRCIPSSPNIPIGLPPFIFLFLLLSLSPSLFHPIMHSSFDARASHPPFRTSVNARVTPQRRLDPRKTTRIPVRFSPYLALVLRRCLVDVSCKTGGLLVRDKRKVINLDSTKQQLGKKILNQRFAFRNIE